jgi:hypothetical protein
METEFNLLALSLPFARLSDTRTDGDYNKKNFPDFFLRKNRDILPKINKQLYNKQPGRPASRAYY